MRSRTFSIRCLGFISRPSVSETPVFMLSAVATIDIARFEFFLAWIFYLQLPGLPHLIAYRLHAFYATARAQILRR